MQMPPLNLLYAATVLLKDGNDAELIDGTSEPDRFRMALNQAEGYDAVVCLVSTLTFHSDTDILSTFKSRNPNLKTIIFGPHPTFMPYYTLAKTAVDFIVQREPEIILRDLVRALRQGGG